MACTTILVGKKASYDGSTMIARNDDSGSGHFTPKKFVVVQPQEQPRHYESVISHVKIELPEQPMRYTAVPNAVDGKGIWAASGVNEAHVAMTATETITSNPRVLGADPLVVYQKAEGGQPEICGGIGEEDLVCLVLPYIRSAREGVRRLGSLLEQYGTYEMNGIAFQDQDEIWWLETIGGHHWIARRVPDDAYVTNPNQLGMDYFEFDNPEYFLCDPDLPDFIRRNHLNLNYDGESFNPRYAFGSQRDKDRHYNTPRAWDIQRFLNPEIEQDPRSFFLPWCQKPYRKITIEDVKYVLSSHYQDSPYDPYGLEGTPHSQRTFRTIGINRTSQTSILHLRPNKPQETTGIQWLSYGSMPYNTAVPFFTQISTTPTYFANTGEKVSTDSFYWTNRLIAALADAHFSSHLGDLDDYQEITMALGHEMLGRVDCALEKGEIVDFEAENQALSDKIQEATDQLLNKILLDAGNLMTNHFSLSD